MVIRTAGCDVGHAAVPRRCATPTHRPHIPIYHRAMWRGFAGLVVLGACSFQASAGSRDAASDGASDVAVRPPDAAIDAPVDMTLPAFCDPADPNVIACYEFEGDTKDGSAHHFDATATNVSFAAGKVGMAMLSGATSAADVADSPELDVTKLTIEAWIKPSRLPSNGNKFIIMDVDRQYGLQLRSDGGLTCVQVGGLTITTPVGLITAGQWTHIACTYDGNASALYVNGVVAASASGSGTLGTAGNTGMSLAADNNPTGPGRASFIGLIDNLRLMNVARTAVEICADAGKSTCP